MIDQVDNTPVSLENTFQEEDVADLSSLSKPQFRKALEVISLTPQQIIPGMKYAGIKIILFFFQFY
jgi:hypothetical protein